MIQNVLNFLQIESKNEELQDVIQQFEQGISKHKSQNVFASYLISLFLIKKKVPQHLFFFYLICCLLVRQKARGRISSEKMIRSRLLLAGKIVLISPILLYLSAVGEEREQKGYVNNGKG